MLPSFRIEVAAEGTRSVRSLGDGILLHGSVLLIQRLIIASFLMGSGLAYLVNTIALTDLVLNAVALETPPPTCSNLVWVDGTSMVVGGIVCLCVDTRHAGACECSKPVLVPMRVLASVSL